MIINQYDSKVYHKNKDELIIKQYNFFKNILIFTNTNWKWYITEWWSINDINNDDDDFLSWNRGWEDDDLDAFSYKYWVINSLKEENILSIDEEYRNISNFDLKDLYKIYLYTNQESKLSLYILDNKNNIKYKYFKDIILENYIDILNNNDINNILEDNDKILLFLENKSTDNNFYLLSWIDKNDETIKYFTSWLNKEKNIDFLSILYSYEDWKFYKESKLFKDILEYGKKPVAPTFLRNEWLTNSWTSIVLAWDLNDFVNTWSIFMYRDSINFFDDFRCDEYNYYKKIDFPINNIELNYDWLKHHYTICSSNFLVDNNKYIFSTNSNILYVE